MECSNNIPLVGELQTLSINRGTNAKYKTQRKDANGNPILTQADEVYFIVKKNWDDKTALITKTLSDMTFDSDGFYHFEITPNDTENLPYGNYVWDFTPVYGDDIYRAKPAKGKFIIGNSSGWIINEKGVN